MLWYTSALLALFLTGLLVRSETNFGYDPDDELGPDKWAEVYKACGGKAQSPVDIEENLVTRVSLPPLNFYGIHDLPVLGIITNDGHTVRLTMESDDPIEVEGGPLRGTYKFVQLHFHWGTNDSFGSEDTINNHSFSMELHMVFQNTKYKTMEEAFKHEDALTVLAIFFEVSEKKNRVYAELIDSLDKLIWPYTDAFLNYQLPLEYMLPPDREHYFTYHGSLTTPPCLEIVTWVQFKHPVSLSHEQLASFRKLRAANNKPMTHNVRPLQPLFNRQVLYNYQDDEDSSAPAIKNAIPLLLLSFSLAFFCLL